MNANLADVFLGHGAADGHRGVRAAVVMLGVHGCSAGAAGQKMKKGVLFVAAVPEG